MKIYYRAKVIDGESDIDFSDLLTVYDVTTDLISDDVDITEERDTWKILSDVCYADYVKKKEFDKKDQPSTINLTIFANSDHGRVGNVILIKVQKQKGNK